MKNFENFTNLYSLSRSLRFELKPIWKSKDLLNENNELFPKDKRIDEIYQNIIKPCLNELHGNFIEKSLENKEFENLKEDIIEKYKKFKQKNASKKDISNFEKIKLNLRKEIISFFNKTKTDFFENYIELFWKKSTEIILKVYWNKIYEKDNSWKIFLYSDLIWKSYNELIEIYFSSFSTYLNNFHTNRKNIYNEEWKVWSVTWRTIEENLWRFLQNCIIFKEKIENNIVLEEKDIFIPVNFWNYINQKWIDNYNQLIWKINSIINEYNQKNNLKKWNKIPKLILLYKQILWNSKSENIFNFVDLVIENDFELESEIRNFIKISNEKIIFIENEIFSDFRKFELEKVFIKRNKLKELSNLFLENYYILEKYLPEYDEEWNIKKGDEIVSLKEIEKVFENVKEENLKEIFKKEYFKKGETWFDLFLEAIYRYFSELKQKLQKALELLNEFLLNWDFSKNLRNNEKFLLNNAININNKWILKIYLDNFLFIDRFVHFFDLIKWSWDNKKIIETDYDTNFYWHIDEYSLDFKPFKIYNSIRNYLTKKQHSTEKIKLNFNYSDFLEWNSIWKYAFIYEEKWNYYIWILNHWFSKSKYKPEVFDYNTWFKMLEYKQIKFNTLAWKWYIRDFWVKYSKDKNAIKNLKTLIKKQYIDKYPALQEILNFETNSKKEFDVKIKEVMQKTYNVNFVNIKKDYIEKLNEDWYLHFFQIYNKDFSIHKKENSKENLHTLYFKALFDKENFLNWTCFKLNSSWAEIFFREKSINNKSIKKLKVENEKIFDKNRFTENKILLHLPITLNFTNKNFFKINSELKEYIKNNKVKIIWIDRWEKHLLYISLIDENGNIEMLESFNSFLINTPTWDKEIKYAEKLIEKEWSRYKERKNWDEIESIKELKEWYISQIIDKIVKLAIKENAIIIMEDLNSGFKRWRQKIERQIYQKFELALAKKLNFVVDKSCKKHELWWIFKAYQLTPKIENFNDIYSQTWIIFYTQAWYTSVTCPCCWFRKNIYKKYENEENFKKLFDEYKFNIESKDEYFIIKYSISKKSDTKWNFLDKTDFSLNTKNQIRYKFEKSLKWPGWNIIEYNISEKFSELFRKYNLNFNNLTEDIKNWKWEVKLYKDFLFYFNLLLQIRNSKENWDNWWYISCPNCNFHSNNWLNWFEFNWDANWAYNIARKWKIIINKIRNNEDKLWITNIEWDNFVNKF